MKSTCFALAVAILLLQPAHRSPADDGVPSQPKPIPQTRPEMKLALEALKQRQPRLPLTATVASTEKQGRIVVHNGRARAIYLPASWYAADFRPDPAMTLDDTFKVRLFWIVSRINNCHYCLGHQEVKLSMAGLSDDEIASLDGDWSGFRIPDQTAMRFCAKLTHEPHTISAADLDALRPHFDNRQLIELVYTVSFFNSVNRWTDSLGLPQDERFRDHPIVLSSPTSPPFRDQASCVALKSAKPRPPLEPRDRVEAELARCRERQARVELPSESEVRKVLPAEFASDPLPQWVRALAAFPTTGRTQILALRAVEEQGRIPAILKAQLAWVAARQDRAWYALGQAQKRLARLGQDRQAAFSLDGDGNEYTPAQREAFAFARKLTATPQAIADADVARLRKRFADPEVAEIVYVVCTANFFDRFTEALGLQLEERTP